MRIMLNAVVDKNLPSKKRVLEVYATVKYKIEGKSFSQSNFFFASDDVHYIAETLLHQGQLYNWQCSITVALGTSNAVVDSFELWV